MITIAFIGLEQVSYEIDMATTPKNNSEQLTPEITAFPVWAPRLGFSCFVLLPPSIAAKKFMQIGSE